MKKLNKLVVAIFISSLSVVCANAADIKIPNLQMKNTMLTFQEIKDYQNYKIVATHFRTDKNELRYVLANAIAYKAIIKKSKIMPDGSKIVKIGWSVKKMATFPSALEADKIQRIEYMIRDKSKHKESDGWGYARFVKKDGKYKAWNGNIQDCVSCHSIMKSNDYLFTSFQTKF